MNKQSPLSLNYSNIHSYINCANVAWGSTYMTNLKRLSSQQKHAIRIICSKGKFEHIKQLFQLNKILNVYKLNILNVATFMYKVNQKTATNIQASKTVSFLSYSKLNYVQPIHNIKSSKYSISIRGPYIWNIFLSSEEKQSTIKKFNAITKSRLLFLENELAFF